MSRNDTITALKALSSSRRRRRTPVRLCLESLENRCLLAADLSFAEPVYFETGAVVPDEAWHAAAPPNTLPFAMKVAVDDFDQDGDKDVVAVNPLHQSNTISVLLGNGDGTLAPARTYPVGVQPVSVTVGDWNGDGFTDLAVGDFYSRDVAVLLGNDQGEGTFGSYANDTFITGLPLFTTIDVQPWDMTAGDFNHDGHLDLALAASGTVLILHGEGTGEFELGAKLTIPAQASNTPAIIATDLNGDLVLDLVVTAGTPATTSTPTPEYQSAIHIFLGNADEPGQGNGTFGQKQENGTFVPSSTELVGGSPSSLVAGNFDRNGITDLVVANRTTRTLSILLGNDDGTGKGNGSFTRGQPIKVGGPSVLRAGDFDGDGITDLVTANETYFHGSVLHGKGDGSFEVRQDFWAGVSPSSLAVADFDGDGRDDLVVSQTRTDQVALVLNNSPQPDDGVTIKHGLTYFEDAPDASAYLKDKHTLDLYLPAQRDFPVVLLVNGGNWALGNSSTLGYLARTLARDGIGAVVINFRISDKSPEAAIWPDHITDVARAYAWTHKNIADYGGDTDNVFVMGHSSGAHLIALLATDPQWLAEQQLDHRAIRGAIGVSGVYDLATQTSAVVPPEASPILHATSDDPPFLLMHGTHGIQELSAAWETQEFHAVITSNAATGGQLDRSELAPIANRDHFQIIGLMSQQGDPGREAILNYIAEQRIWSDLRVTNIVASNHRPGRTITLTATIANQSENDAPASQAEFRLDGEFLAMVNTPAIAAGDSATVTYAWKTAGVRGEHVITVRADQENAVQESNESNNAASLTVTIKGNKVQNGSFEQPNSDGSGPDGWSSISTAAGTASWNAETGSVSLLGTGGSALLAGSPTWTSAPITVSAGEVLNLTATVSSMGSSSSAAVSLAYFDAQGQLLPTIQVLSVPGTTSSLVSLQQQVTVPWGATSARIVLTGFAADDLATEGKVVFEEIGLFALDAASLDAFFASLNEEDED